MKGNQWVFISPDHKANYFWVGYLRGGWLTSHVSWKFKITIWAFGKLPIQGTLTHTHTDTPRKRISKSGRLGTNGLERLTVENNLNFKLRKAKQIQKWFVNFWLLSLSTDMKQKANKRYDSSEIEMIWFFSQNVMSLTRMSGGIHNNTTF